jgi:hypothetical protein
MLLTEKADGKFPLEKSLDYTFEWMIDWDGSSSACDRSPTENITPPFDV